MPFLALLPLVALLACAAFLHNRHNSGKGFRIAIVQASIIAAAWCVLGTELLSLFKQVRVLPLILWWSVPSAVFGLLLWKRHERPQFRWPQLLSPIERVFLAGILALLVIAFVVALSTPPNNYDSQEYHLPRQWNWAQQGHVGTFAANDERQISMPPFAEFAGLHLMILAGGDRPSNLVQWWALVLVALVASLTADRLGGTRRTQLFAALFAVSYPTALLQAMNTKNDVVTAFFVCAAAFYAAVIALDGKCSWKNALFLAASIGLAMLSKGTGMLFCIPISLFAGAIILWFHRFRGFAIGALITAVVCLINVGHFTRNYVEFDSFFGRSPEKGGYSLRNETRAPAAVLSNVSRNIAMHLTFTKWSNVVISNAVASMHDALRLPLNDPRTTYDSGGPFEVANAYPKTEDQSRAPIHMTIAIITFVMVLWPREGSTKRHWLFLLIPFAAFLAFCVELKWQIWHNRLHIPLFCLVAPVAALGIARFRFVQGSLGVMMLLSAIPTAAKNTSKPLLGRNSFVFKSSDDVRFSTKRFMQPALQWVEELCRSREPRVIGIHAHPHTWIYPVQRMAGRLPSKPQVFLLNPVFGKDFAETNLAADLVISVLDEGTGSPAPTLVDAGGRTFQFAGEYCNLRVYFPARAKFNLPSIPPFHGWQQNTGLSKWDGPVPKKGLPVVRSGLMPETVLKFRSDGSELTFKATGRAEEGLENVPVTILLNGAAVYTGMFNNEFANLAFPIRPQRGMNELRIEYSPTTNPERAVLWKQLQIAKQ